MSDLLQLSSMSSPVEIVDLVFAQAVRLKASDILFEPQEKTTLVRFRVDGVLTTFGEMPPGTYTQVLTRVKVLGNMDVTESRKPQESKIRFDIEGHPYVCRVAIVTTNFGQMIVFRVLDIPEFSEFAQLGMLPEMGKMMQESIAGRYGLFLVAGPTGSGKTTTVHTCLRYLNNGEMNIMSIEDPVEYIMPGVNQIEVGQEIGLDFVSGLRMILRLNPDVVFVGEIRDAETARVAIQASLTGHLVISTIHSRNSAGALYRLMDLGVDRYMINYAVRGILSQHLMRRVCDHCKTAVAPTEEGKKLMQKEIGDTNFQLFTGKGCDWCVQTGYKGRVGVFEMLKMDDKVRDLVLAGGTEEEFRKKLVESGFADLNTEGIRLVKNGATTIKEYLRTMYDSR